MKASQEEGRWEDLAALATPSATVDLVELFFQLARLKASLCADIDLSLRATHGLTLEAFDALTAISKRSEGWGESALACALGLSQDETRAIIDTLVASGRASRTAGVEAEEPSVVRLTLRGGLDLNRAVRTVDQSLERRLGSALSRDDLVGLEDILAGLRERAGPVEGPPANDACRGRRARHRAPSLREATGT